MHLCVQGWIRVEVHTTGRNQNDEHFHHCICEHIKKKTHRLARGQYCELHVTSHFLFNRSVGNVITRRLELKWTRIISWPKWFWKLPFIIRNTPLHSNINTLTAHCMKGVKATPSSLPKRSLLEPEPERNSMRAKFIRRADTPCFGWVGG